MCNVVEDLILSTKAEIIINVMDSLNITVDRALIIANIPESERDRVKTLVEESDRATAECTINAMRTSRFH